MFLIGIAGGSGSGKTTFAKKIFQKILEKTPSSSIALLHQDSYYLPEPPFHLRVHGEPNFDHPDAFDWNLLREHLNLLKKEESVDVPVYDFKISRRTSEVQQVGPCKIALFEGIFGLWDAEVRNSFDLKIYLNVEADIRFIRRLHRDVKERGRSLDTIIRQYYDTVRPMHHAYLHPTRQYADLIVGEKIDAAADLIALASYGIK